MRAAVEAIYHWVSFPDVCCRWGESERQLSLLPCPAVISLSQQTAVQRGEKKGSRIKGTNYILPTNVWTNVKVGQRGNFSIISTAAALSSVKGDVQQGRPLM